MPIELVEVDLAEMQRTALLNRAKSPAVRALYEAMFSMESGQAKAAVAEAGEDLSQIRNLVAQCATRAQIDMQIVIDRVGGRVLFTPNPQQSAAGGTSSAPVPRVSVSRTPEEQAAMVDRRDTIRQAALALGAERPQISAQEVVDYMRDSGEVLDLARPTTAVSAVMRNMTQFERVGQSRFSFIG